MSEFYNDIDPFEDYSEESDKNRETIGVEPFIELAVVILVIALTVFGFWWIKSVSKETAEAASAIAKMQTQIENTVTK